MKFPEDFVNKIICGDALKILPLIPDNSIDMLLLDPPYMISSSVKIRRQRNPMKFGKVYKYQGKDISFEFGDWDIFPSLEAYLDFSKKWFIEAIRVLRKAGSIVSFWDKHKLTYMVNWANELNVKNRQCLWWVKTNPVPQARKVGFMSAVECMWWGTKFSTSRKDGYVFHYELGQHPDYFKHSIVGHTTKIDGERAHPTQKPIKLGEWIISYLSNKGDIVLDPFCGSGTFCIAAKRLGRRYIGIDISEEYCEGARQRLRQTEEPLF